MPRFPNHLLEPIDGRPFKIDPIMTVKRDLINARGDTLLTQDFFDEVDRRTITVNGAVLEVVTKCDFDVLGSSIGEIKRRTTVRGRRGF